MPKIAYWSRQFRQSPRFDGAVMYCSDGRFGRYVEEFVQSVLRWTQYDAVQVPGGPARLANREGHKADYVAARNDLQFLIHAHQLDRIALIAHVDCTFYLRVLGISAEGVEEVQRRDLLRAAQTLWEISPNLEIEAYFMNLADQQVVFEEVALLSPSSSILQP